MPISAGCPELLPPVGYSTCLLHNPWCIDQLGNVRRMARLLVGNRRFCCVLIALLLLPLLGLEGGGSTQKPLADANCDLVVPSKRPLLAHSDPALALQRLTKSICCPLAAVGVGWPHMGRHCLLLPKQRLQPLLEWQHQPHVPHYQLAHLARQISVDDLDVPTDVVALVVPRHKHHHAVLDEHVAVASLHCVAVPDAQ
jgi:hypothetical protein